jgi:cytochrome P450
LICLCNQVGGQFLAGYHTSSSTLSWIFIHLTRSPEIQAKLRDILHTTYNTAHAEGRAPSYDELSKSRVPYLDAVIEEVLRLHATLLSRTATRDTQLFGRHIPKGTTVWMLCNGPGFQSPSFDAAVAQRGPTAETSFSKDWDEKTRDMFTFEPERWLRKKERATPSSSTTTTAADNDVDALEYNANAAPQFAFGQGLRGCWGRRIAYVELRIVVTLLIWQFDLLPVLTALNNTSATLSVISRADACYVRLRRRKDTRDT